MAELGGGPHRTGDVADTLQPTSQSLAPTRAKLIEKGMIWSPNHGSTAFTVAPLRSIHAPNHAGILARVLMPSAI